MPSASSRVTRSFCRRRELLQLVAFRQAASEKHLGKCKVVRRVNVEPGYPVHREKADCFAIKGVCLS